MATYNEENIHEKMFFTDEGRDKAIHTIVDSWMHDTVFEDQNAVFKEWEKDGFDENDEGYQDYIYDMIEERINPDEPRVFQEYDDEYTEIISKRRARGIVECGKETMEYIIVEKSEYQDETVQIRWGDYSCRAINNTDVSDIRYGLEEFIIDDRLMEEEKKKRTFTKRFNNIAENLLNSSRNVNYAVENADELIALKKAFDKQAAVFYGNYKNNLQIFTHNISEFFPDNEWYPVGRTTSLKQNKLYVELTEKVERVKKYEKAKKAFEERGLDTSNAKEYYYFKDSGISVMSDGHKVMYLSDNKLLITKSDINYWKKGNKIVEEMKDEMAKKGISPLDYCQKRFPNHVICVIDLEKKQSKTKVQNLTPDEKKKSNTKGKGRA